jgi:hypothetical protein
MICLGRYVLAISSYGYSLITYRSDGYTFLIIGINVEPQIVPPISKYKYKIEAYLTDSDPIQQPRTDTTM